MKKIISIALTIVILCSTTSIYSQYANLEFVENKGQWDESVRFKGILNNGAFFLQEKGFKVLQNKVEDIQKMAELAHGFSDDTAANTSSAKLALPIKDNNAIVVHSHAYKVEFINADKPQIVPDKKIISYNNYFIGNDPTKWKSDCDIFQAVTYKDLYKSVDVRYYTNEGRLKYDLLVHPGADLQAIVMKYDGVEDLKIVNGQLVIKTSVGEIRELAPYAFQIINGVKKEVPCRFKVIGKTVSFAVDNYISTSELVIDPTLVFATLSGSRGDNWGYTATYGPGGTFFAGGIVFSDGFPTSTGAFSTVYSGGTNDEGTGGYDIGIMKFDASGATRLYATYIGGSSNEQPHSMVVDPQGNLIIAGRTNSANYPVNRTNYGNGGGYDIVLTKLNATGTALLGSRKIGGTKSDGVNIKPKYPLPSPAESIRRNYGDDARSEVILDRFGNILLASNTQSDNYPVTTGVFQPSFGGIQDGVVIKVTPDLNNVLFSTFLGGDKNDAAFVLAIKSDDNNIYVGGNTVSTNMPGDKTSVLYPSFSGGEADGFVSILNENGSSLLKTSYFGTTGNDMLYGIQFDKFNYPYIMGTTTSDDWPILNAAYSQAKGKQFIAKLKPDLSAYEYSTVFGTGTFAPNISPVAFLVDRCENVYVSGWGGQVNTRAGYPTSGTRGLPVTPDAIQSTSDNSDFYFFVLERNATRQLYGSFFGQRGGFGEHVDGGTSRFDRNGVIYQALCANCGRDVTFPTTPGVWSPTNGSSSCNLAAVKIAFNLAGVSGSVRASIEGVVGDTSGCVPLTVNFTDTIANGTKYIWNFGDGTEEQTTTEPTLDHTFGKVGSYIVRLVSIDSSKCNISDTAYTTIRVKTDKAMLSYDHKKLQPCTSSSYSFTNTSFVSPAGKTFTDTSFIWTFGDNTAPVKGGLNSVTHNFPGPGVYKVRLTLNDTNFCNYPDFIEKSLRIATNVKAAFSTPSSGCAPYNALFENTSDGGQQFYWDFGDNTTSNETSPQHLYETPGTYLVKLRVVDSSTCNVEDSARFTLVVSSGPTAAYTFSPQSPKENTPVQFINNSIGATRYSWSFGDGEKLETTSIQPFSHIYNETNTYTACLVAINNIGCTDTACNNVPAIVVPVLDIPNAFTPNGDGINDKVQVRGFGITRMLWRIYNRWGTLVFESRSRTEGWDGTYKGNKQPTEVYHYVLDVQYSDNTQYQKKGDITLLR